MTPREYLLSLNKEFITRPDIARAIDIDASGLHYRISVLPPEELPENNGAFRVGGYTTFTIDAAIAWTERHVRYWAARQAARGESE